MTVWTSAAEVSTEQRQAAAAVLGAMGREIAVDDEDEEGRNAAISAAFDIIVEEIIDRTTASW